MVAFIEFIAYVQVFRHPVQFVIMRVCSNGLILSDTKQAVGHEKIKINEKM